MRPLILPLVLSLLSLPACGGDTGTTTEPATGKTGDATSTATTDAPTSTGFCGDGTIDNAEDCDGDDLGDKTCATLDAMWSAGDLQCSADCKYVTNACEVDTAAAQVALNEVTSKGVSDGPFADKGDLIELTNVGAETIDLAGWKLSDDPTFPIAKTYVFPPGSSLGVGEFFVLAALHNITLEGDFPFGLSSTNEETLTLANASGVPVDTLIVQGADAAISYCRIPDGTGAWQHCDPTFGSANLVAASVCGDGEIEADEICDGDQLGGVDCKALGFTGGALACSALCRHDASGCDAGSMLVINELESSDDRIELHNAGAVEIDVSGWVLTDDPIAATYDAASDTEKLVFPANSIIAPKEFLVVAKGELAGQHPFGLAGDGDAVTLRNADLEPQSHVTYGPAQAALSYCRLPDGPKGAWTVDCIPTLGAANKGP